MTPEEFEEKMREIFRYNDDPEAEHAKADRLMLELLRSLGYEQGCKIFEEADKWYA